MRFFLESKRIIVNSYKKIEKIIKKVILKLNLIKNKKLYGLNKKISEGFFIKKKFFLKLNLLLKKHACYS